MISKISRLVVRMSSMLATTCETTSPPRCAAVTATLSISCAVRTETCSGRSPSGIAGQAVERSDDDAGASPGAATADWR